MFLELDNLLLGVMSTLAHVLYSVLRRQTNVKRVRDEEEGRYPSLEVLGGVHLHEPVRWEELRLVMPRDPAQGRQGLHQHGPGQFARLKCPDQILLFGTLVLAQHFYKLVRLCPASVQDVTDSLLLNV